MSHATTPSATRTPADDAALAAYLTLHERRTLWQRLRRLLALRTHG